MGQKGFVDQPNWQQVPVDSLPFVTGSTALL